VAVPLDEPLGVVELDEVGDGVAEVVEVVVEPGPQALFFEGLDPSFGAAVGLGFAEVGGVVGDAEPAQRALEVDRPVLASPVVAMSGASSPQRSTTAS
jgi:hypothetical protein